MTFTHALSTNNYGPTKFIVATSAANGTHTTLASAMAAASVGDTIFLRDSVTENVTITPGVNITAWSASELNTPSITGKLTMTGAGTSTISGIDLITNSDFAIAVTGSAASVLYVNNCYINCTNNTGISYTSSNSSSVLTIANCRMNTATTGIANFACSSTGRLTFNFTLIVNTGSSTTANTCSAGTFSSRNCSFPLPLTYSSPNDGSAIFCSYVTTNQTAITASGTGTFTIQYAQISTGTATAIVVGSGVIFALRSVVINSSNAAAVSGAGFLNYCLLGFSNGSNSSITVTGQGIDNEGPSKTIGSTNSGGTNTLTVINQSNTASSAANIISQVAGGTAADPTHQSIVNGVTTWTWGADNSDSDAWALAASATLGTTNVMRAGTTGEVTFPLTPAFFAYVNTTITNVTGDGTNYTIIYDTEVFDQGNNFNLGTSTFTAPVTGKYQFNFIVRIQGGTSIVASFCTIATTSLTVRCSTPLIGTTNVNCQGTFPLLINMTAGDTMTTTIQITDSGGKVDDISGVNTSQPQTYLSGYLAC